MEALSVPRLPWSSQLRATLRAVEPESLLEVESLKRVRRLVALEYPEPSGTFAQAVKANVSKMGRCTPARLGDGFMSSSYWALIRAIATGSHYVTEGNAGKRARAKVGHLGTKEMLRSSIHSLSLVFRGIAVRTIEPMRSTSLPAFSKIYRTRCWKLSWTSPIFTRSRFSRRQVHLRRAGVPNGAARASRRSGVGIWAGSLGRGERLRSGPVAVGRVAALVWRQPRFLRATLCPRGWVIVDTRDGSRSPSDHSDPHAFAMRRERPDN